MSYLSILLLLPPTCISGQWPLVYNNRQQVKLFLPHFLILYIFSCNTCPIPPLVIMHKYIDLLPLYINSLLLIWVGRDPDKYMKRSIIDLRGGIMVRIWSRSSMVPFNKEIVTFHSTGVRVMQIIQCHLPYKFTIWTSLFITVLIVNKGNFFL